MGITYTEDDEDNDHSYEDWMDGGCTIATIAVVEPRTARSVRYRRYEWTTNYLPTGCMDWTFITTRALTA